MVLGEAHLGAGQTDLASRDFEKVVSIAAADGGKHARMAAIAETRLGAIAIAMPGEVALEDASRHYGAARTWDADNVDAWLGLGAAGVQLAGLRSGAEAQALYDQAASAFRHAMRLAPAVVDAQTGMGAALFGLGAIVLAFLLMSGIGFATSTVEQGNFLAMQSLSQSYAKNPNLDPALFEVLRGMVSASRNWIHFLDKFLVGGTLVLLHLALFRANLLPRLITGFGMLAALTQISFSELSSDTPFLVPYQGMLPISSLGCDLTMQLIVTGPMRNRLVMVAEEEDGLYPNSACSF